MKRLALLSIAVTTLTVATLAGTARTAAAQSLYDELGGLPFIECWIDESLPIIVADDRISDFFAGPLNAGQPENLRDSLVLFACDRTGGPCEYEGRDMTCAHAGLAISNADFTAFIEDLELGAQACMKPAAYPVLAKFLRSLRDETVQDDPGEDPLASRKGRKRCLGKGHGGDDDDEEDDD